MGTKLCSSRRFWNDEEIPARSFNFTYHYFDGALLLNSSTFSEYNDRINHTFSYGEPSVDMYQHSSITCILGIYLSVNCVLQCLWVPYLFTNMYPISTNIQFQKEIPRYCFWSRFLIIVIKPYPTEFIFKINL